MGDLTFAGPTPGYYEESVSFCLGGATPACDDDAAHTGAEGDEYTVMDMIVTAMLGVWHRILLL